MASITKRTNKTGAVSYLIRAFVETGASGKQITKSVTWKPPAGMRPSAADKQAEKEAILFEERVRSGIVSLDGKTKFEEYAARWMDTAQISPATREHYIGLLRRINAAIGHIPLEKLRADHVEVFLKNLRENGIKTTGKYAISSCFETQRKAAKLTQKQISERSGVSINTIAAAGRGDKVSQDTAQKLCAALGIETVKAFTLLSRPERLSDRTIWHHHKLIRAVLANAKKTRIIPHNVAQEFMEAPRLPRDEAQYLNDEEARLFLAALQNEPDIRIKTALTLSLFTGLRRGELCGLAWPDIDEVNNAIRVRRASQYIVGQGVIEVPTKNKSSDRAVTVPLLVMEELKEYRRWWSEYRLSLGDAWRGFQQRLFIKADGTPIFPGTINLWLRAFMQRNSLPDVTPHALRHTFITLQLAAGVDIRTLQARSGHAQASTLLNTYAHAIQSAQERAAQAMSDMLLPAAK